jgi:hypothetical protein
VTGAVAGGEVGAGVVDGGLVLAVVGAIVVTAMVVVVGASVVVVAARGCVVETPPTETADLRRE